MALDQYKTQILLLHSQQSTLDNLSTGFNDQYSVHLATSGTEALNIFSETPVHVIVSAQDLPGMSGLDALREAKKRSPDTIGILLAGTAQDDGLEALVGEQEVFQIVRGEIAPDALRSLIDSATKSARMLALAKSANDTSADPDQLTGEHIVMETSENGASIVSDGTGRMPALRPEKISVIPDAGGQSVDVLVLTKDEEFLVTIRESSRGLHNVYHAVTPTQANEIVRKNKIGVLVTDAAMVGSNIEVLNQKLRESSPRLVAVVAGRRDDGELLMDLINRGQVYRFLLKPVSPGRARLAIEASVKHHLEAADKAFKPRNDEGSTSNNPPAKSPPQSKPVAKAAPEPSPARKPDRPAAPPPVTESPVVEQPAMTASRDDSLVSEGLEEAFSEGGGFAETVTGLAANVGKKFSRSAKPENSAETEAATLSESSSDGGAFASPKIIGIAAGVLLSLGAAGWYFYSGDSETTAETVQDQQNLPTVVESDVLLPPSNSPIVDPAPSSTDVLEAARARSDGGQLVAPEGDNAVELYLSALASSPNDLEIQSELNDVVERVVGIAETAILEQRLDDAATALHMIELASPENPRLSFLSAQLTQIQLRTTIDDARAAIRENRFEDAGALILQADGLAGAGSSEVDLLAQELAAARSEQQVGQVLELATARVEQNRLITPANDNARYYYELALSNDPENTQARQGLSVVAGKLVLQARTAIDNGQLNDAEILLSSARALDSGSDEIAAASTVLADARAKIVADQRRREAQRLQRIEQERLAAEAEAEAQRLQQQAAAADSTTSQTDEVTAKFGPATGGSSSAIDRSADNTSPPPNESRSNVSAVNTNALPEDGPVQLSANNASGGAEQAPLATDNSQSLAVQVAAPRQPEVVAVSTLTRINYVSPKYPRSAQRRNVTGSVDVMFTVSRNGTVTDIEVLDSAPGTVFDQAAMDAVAKWRFEPSLDNGQAVEKRTAVRLSFDLQ